jgi:hypothetical protein
VSDVSFPGPGQDGEQPPPGEPARDEADNFDLDAEMASYLSDIGAGREQVPDPWEEVPACTVSLGEACDVDPAGLAAMCGPDGLGGQHLPRAPAAGHRHGNVRPLCGPQVSAGTQVSAITRPGLPVPA